MIAESDTTYTSQVSMAGESLIDRIVRLLPEEWQFPYVDTIVGLLLLGVLVLFLHLLVRRWLQRLFIKLGTKANDPWYNALLENKVPQRALFMLPLLIFYTGIEWVSDLPEGLLEFSMRLINVAMILVVARTIDAFLSTLHSIHLLHTTADRRPIKSYIQIGKVIIYVITGILIIAQLANQSPWYFLSGIGALTAIILLIFRDTLLSLVASVQLTNNDSIRVGDWIEMPEFGADGYVVDIALNNVRVQNFDKTLTIIPTHKFLEHSFRNWRGMQESGGRRIMRSVLLDVESIRFLNKDDINRFQKSRLLKGYIDAKLKEINEYNEQFKGDEQSLTNTRWLTNIGTFRAYAYEYLKQHPKTNKELFTLVRQLEPTAQGVPLQMYAFTNTIQWGDYEGIQADIFDHLLAVLPEFGLRHYQQPSGWDFDKLQKKEN